MPDLARTIRSRDCIHFPTLPGSGSGWRKEWIHFCVLGDELDAIFNLSLSGHPEPGAPLGPPRARILVLLYADGWSGGIEPVEPNDVHIRPGSVDVRMGTFSVAFDGVEYLLEGSLPRKGIEFSLRLLPRTAPLDMRSGAAIGEGRISWFVIPRLLASGTVRSGSKSFRLRNVPAYHDHNWGNWLWGHDFAWEWGFALPEDPAVPWAVVFDRTTNRPRTRSHEAMIAVWRGDTLWRLFSQDEVMVRRYGFVQPAGLSKFPEAMGLVAPELTTEIPEALEVRAERGGDSLNLVFRGNDPAQIVIPNETDLGVTIINEVPGPVEVTGTLKGERVEMTGRGVFEFLV
jgi:hypothetical protein